MTAVLGVALAALGTLLLGVLRVPRPPDLFYLPVGAVSRRGHAVPAMLTGLLAGLAQDALTSPGRLFGLNAFSKVLLAYLMAAIGARALVQKPVMLGLLVWSAVALDGIVLYGLLWVLRGEPLLPDLFSLAVRAAGTGLLAALLQALVRYPWKEARAARRRRKLA
jgi:rod shape-determining protein MreD